MIDERGSYCICRASEKQDVEVRLPHGQNYTLPLSRYNPADDAIVDVLVQMLRTPTTRAYHHHQAPLVSDLGAGDGQ